MPTRLLIVGLDGADGRLLDEATQDGALPHLAALRQRGRAWPLSASPDATDDALWASFQYGVDLGEHGRSTYLLQDDNGKTAYAPHLEADRELFWDRLCASGHRVAVIDVPKCPPPRPLNGIHLTDWLVHGRYHPTPRSYPATLADEIITRFGAAPPSRCGYSYDTPTDDATVITVRQNLLRAVDMKRRAGVHFLSREAWDLFIIGFKEAHCSQHMFWHFSDPAHRLYDPDRVARLGNPVRDVLQAQDAAIGDLVRQAGDDTDILVFSTTDFAPNGSLMHMADRIAAGINDWIAAETDGKWLTMLRRRIRRPRMICRAVFRSDDGLALRVPVRPGESQQAHRARIERVAALGSELTDPSDGSRAIASVTYPAFEQTGSCAHSLPHVVLHYRTNSVPSAVASPRLGRIAAPAPDMRTGNHVPGGFAFAAGSWADQAQADISGITDMPALITQRLAAPRRALADAA